LIWLDSALVKLELQVLSVSLPISFQFRPPEFRTGFRHPCEGAVFVRVPKAAVNKDNFLAGTEHEIRTPRQIPRVEPVPIPHGEHKSTDKQLGAGVLGADPRHDLRTLGWRDGIHTFYISPDFQKNNGLSSLQHDYEFYDLCKLWSEPNKGLRRDARFPGWELQARGAG